MSTQHPEKIALHLKSRTLELAYGGQSYQLPAEYLRVHSPSAEVRGHGRGQEKLQTGKRQVALIGIEPSGHYALKLVFDDGHDSGLYDWNYLHDLALNQERYWQRYLDKLAEEGGSRDH
ncbi:gamma-butyrobetaine hydroxylase-like domain-containing protein [Motiliproteus sediminis]|uniref:gamma-butyrobetaine hydroxylase-like domain-containing protein n=1 Tax=Motiliproteus sediminis TaxID=1468178 RepID=UPI001AEFBBB7